MRLCWFFWFSAVATAVARADAGRLAVAYCNPSAGWLISILFVVSLVIKDKIRVSPGSLP